MITLDQVKMLIARHNTLMAQMRKPGQEISNEEKRWCFMVTPEEISSLVDECQAVPETSMPEEAAQHIRDCAALLHIDNVALIPELMEVPAGGVN